MNVTIFKKNIQLKTQIFKRHMHSLGFSGDSVVKESACQHRSTGDVDLISGSRISREEKMATHFSILAWNPTDGEDLQAPVHGVTKSWTRPSTHSCSNYTMFSYQNITKWHYILFTNIRICNKKF